MDHQFIDNVTASLSWAYLKPFLFSLCLYSSRPYSTRFCLESLFSHEPYFKPFWGLAQILKCFLKKEMGFCRKTKNTTIWSFYLRVNIQVSFICGEIWNPRYVWKTKIRVGKWRIFELRGTLVHFFYRKNIVFKKKS